MVSGQCKKLRVGTEATRNRGLRERGGIEGARAMHREVRWQKNNAIMKFFNTKLMSNNITFS